MKERLEDALKQVQSVMVACAKDEHQLESIADLRMQLAVALAGGASLMVNCTVTGGNVRVHGPGGICFGNTFNDAELNDDYWLITRPFDTISPPFRQWTERMSWGSPCAAPCDAGG